MRRHPRACAGIVVGLAILALAHATITHAAPNAWENPDYWAPYWYRLALDRYGQFVLGDGHGYAGGTWFYYPQTGWWRQWYYNGPYDPDRKAELQYHVFITPTDPQREVTVEIRMSWTTPAWSALLRNRPPLPADASDPNLETLYMAGYDVYDGVGMWDFQSVEPVVDYEIDSYNPEWVSIDFRGHNFYVFRGAIHDCVAETPQPGTGACCNQTTGDCSITEQQDCHAPRTWLGEGVSCSQCPKPAPDLDFGDAPDPTYPTLSASNGARHIIVPGIRLGALIDAEPDGQPDITATGDDNAGLADEDGVTFTSALIAGGAATVAIEASVAGVLGAWIDFNHDDDFADPNEHIFTDRPVAAGRDNLSFPVPADAHPGPTYARFRFSTIGGLSYDGPAPNGEVEDYPACVRRAYAPEPTTGRSYPKWSRPPAPCGPAEPYQFCGTVEQPATDALLIVADEWLCQDPRPVTGITWWGAFGQWQQPCLPGVVPNAFHIAIWTDAPDPDPNSQAAFSHPGTLIWETHATSWAWNIAGFDHDPGRQGHGDTCFQFTHVLSQDRWFTPDHGPEADPIGVVYWLSVTPLYDPSHPHIENPWGWKTKPHDSYDAAVRIVELDTSDVARQQGETLSLLGAEYIHGEPIGADTHTPLDMAFELTTTIPAYADNPIPGDLNTDGRVDALDLAILANNWLNSAR